MVDTPDLDQNLANVDKFMDCHQFWYPVEG